MPLRPRSNQSQQPTQSPSTGKRRGRQKNYALIMGLALGLLAAVLVAVGLTRLQNQAEVVIASQSIPMYSEIKQGATEFAKVPADSVTDADLTRAEFDALQRQGSLVTRVEILPGQRIQEGALATSSVGSFAVVKSDERIVALNTSFSGIAAGAVVPGSVVDVLSGDDGTQPVLTNVKVLAVGPSSEVAAQVENSKGKAAPSEDNSLVVLLAVKASEANTLAALGSATMAVNPRLSFNSKGNICRVGISCDSESSGAAEQENTAPAVPEVDPTVDPSTDPSATPEVQVAPDASTDPSTPTAPSGQ